MIREYLAKRRQVKEGEAWKQDFFGQIRESITRIEAGEPPPHGMRRANTPWNPRWGAQKYVEGALRIGNGNAVDYLQAMANDPYGMIEEDYRVLHKHNLIWLLTKRKKPKS